MITINESRNGETATKPDRPGRLWRALAIAGVVVAVEYLRTTLLNAGVQWNPRGIAAHMLLDVAALTPLVWLALGVGGRAARALGFRRDEWSGLLGTAGVTVIVFTLLTLPLTATRDLGHEWFGTTYGFALAERQTTVVGSDLTVAETDQLCSFSALRGGGDAPTSLAEETAWRLRLGVQDALVQLAVLMPLLLLGLAVARRRELPTPNLRPAVEAVRASRGVLKLGAAASVALLLLTHTGHRAGGPGLAEAGQGGGLPNACLDGGPDKVYNVSAIDIELTLNRWGDHVDKAYMYALDANIPAIEAFQANLAADRALPEDQDPTRVSYGLRKDPIQPLVIRANLGECLVINLTNRLAEIRPVSMHILGLAHTVENAGSATGYNPDSMVQPGETITYRIPMPRDPAAERAYYFHDHGAARQRVNLGLFGAIVAEPAGAVYLDPETGQPLDTITGSNWEAIIVDPNVAGREDAKSFREFVLMYHEIGDESFTNIRDRDEKLLPLIDELAGIYRPGARAINYRSEPFRNRIAQDKESNGSEAGHGKSLGYSSYPFGDPATPIPRSYVGEAVKTRLMHGGSEVFHVHHLHGGGDRWRRNPQADPNSDFWKGLTKVPDPALTSIHLDSQSIGPGTSFNLEHECGAGGCQQAVGDFLYHCHIGHHYLAGMWSFWRVYGTIQTAQTNLAGNPLAVIPRLFQADNPFSDEEAGSNTPPRPSVSAGALLGLTVDDGRTIVADANVTDTSTQIGVLEWIRQMLPPQGVRLDSGDATVWNWGSSGTGANLKIWGEPEEATAFPGYVAKTPGQRPEVRFNPKNGRYVWPLFRPQLAKRPPFSARHSGAPWLGEEMREGRMDGLCARNGVHPGVDVGPAVDRYYPVSTITLPVPIVSDASDPDGMIFVLNEEEQAIRNGTRPAEPLTIRSNVGDCVEIMFTNKIPDGPLNKEFSKTNIHSHFVQFDPQASDGVITGFAYEQSVRPYENEDRRIQRNVAAGARFISVNNTERLRRGVWIGVGLGEGVCSIDANGQPRPCTEVRRIVGIPNPNVIILDRPLEYAHAAGEAVGVEFVRYRWYSDVDFGTVFFHTHVDFKDWDRGLFGTHVVEPKGSTYHDPITGEQVRSGTLVDIRVDPAAGGNPVAAGVNGSFREFMLFLHNNSPVEGQFTLGGGTINLRAEPWRLRDDPSLDDAYRFSSVAWGDPHTPIVQAYPNDPVVIRGTGLVERVGGVRFAGHRFNQERNTFASDIRDTTFIGISERFDVSLQGGAGGPDGYPGDYLYYSTLGKDFESGAWGLLRVHGNADSGLQPLPGRGLPDGSTPFPELGETGAAPPSLDDGPGDACPEGAPVREYSLAVTNTTILYNELSTPDIGGVAYQPLEDVSDTVRTPVVMRANHGDCLRINLENQRSEPSAISLGELVFDPQRSYGSAIGYNYDSSVLPGATRTYEYYADQELGLVLGVNLADVDSIERGAFAGVVIETAGSTYQRPGLAGPLPQGGLGIQADIVAADGVSTKREFVALFSDEDRRIGHNTMPYNVEVERFAGINYSHDPLGLRNLYGDPGNVFSSNYWGDPRHVVTVPAGTPLVYRVGQAWGNQLHVPTLEGHRYFQEPGMAGSEQVFSDVLGPGMSLNLYFVGGAGGDIAAPGDYLFLDRRQPFLEYGLWHILRVTGDQTATAADKVTIADVRSDRRASDEWVTIEGWVGLRPAGDTARKVDVYSGRSLKGNCGGRFVGTAQVDPGSGAWQLEVAARDVKRGFCVASAAGGTANGAL